LTVISADMAVYSRSATDQRTM